MREAIGTVLSPFERRVWVPYLDVARVQLDEAAWEEALAEGRAMTPEEALDYALSEEDSAPSATSRLDHPLAGTQSVALTRREREVAALVAQGLTNHQIAAELFISEHTVENHVARILNKLNLHSREQVAYWIAER